MKKLLIAGALLVAAVLVFIFAVVQNGSDIKINTDNVVSAEIYQFSSDKSEIQRMKVTQGEDIDQVAMELAKIRPQAKAFPLDGNYAVQLRYDDGTTFVFVYEDGIVTTSNGVLGKVQNDNILNYLWARLDYPVENVSAEELPDEA